METITLDHDIRVMCITAASFPEEVLDAHEKLQTKVPFSADRKCFGLSRPEHGGQIVYRAAAEELIPGEAEELNCDTMVIKKGKYLSLTVHHYMKDVQNIGQAFEELLAQPGLDPQGYCVEWYVSDKEVRCMIRLNTQ